MRTGRDYSLTGPEAQVAVERGLASATWYQTPVPRDQLRDLMLRSNGRAAVDTLMWIALLVGSGALAFIAWGSWWALPAFFLYGTCYGSACDSRWHECGHATAFRTRWPNTVVYHLASFMAFREPVSWRWSHTRHHDDTIVVGRDKEIAVHRPTSLWRLALELVGWFSVWAELRKLGHNLLGRLDPQDEGFVPASERRRAVWSGRVMVVLLAAPVVASFATGSVLPALFVGLLPSMYGRWLLVVYGLTQHAGLAEDVLDHRLNTRTVRMNALNRFVYSNMNFHIEHHMFPSVPYHRLPELHELVRHDMPPVYDGLRSAYREILPALRRQAKDPTYFVQRSLPEPVSQVTAEADHRQVVAVDGWVAVCAVDDLGRSDVRRFDLGDRTFAIHHTDDDGWYATDGRCTHGRAHLATGHLAGALIECPKHNGRFDVTTGRALGAPALIDIGCHPVRVVDDVVQLYVGDGHDLQAVSVRPRANEERTR